MLFVGTPEEIWTHLEGTCANPFSVIVNPTFDITINEQNYEEYNQDPEPLSLDGQDKEYEENKKCEQDITNDDGTKNH